MNGLRRAMLMLGVSVTALLLMLYPQKPLTSGPRRQAAAADAVHRTTGTTASARSGRARGTPAS